MGRHKIDKGLELPITGEPDQTISDGARSTTVAIVAADYVGMRPKMAVNPGDTVARGQVLFEDKKIPGVRSGSRRRGPARWPR